MAKRCKCGKAISDNKIACGACAVPLIAGNGVLEILNVGAGDIKITFDKTDELERIRARKIVTDMLRRGYAVVVEIEVGGAKAYERIHDFDEAKGEYIIRDPEVEAPKKRGKYKTKEKRVPMETARATAIGRSAGG